MPTKKITTKSSGNPIKKKTTITKRSAVKKKPVLKKKTVVVKKKIEDTKTLAGSQKQTLKKIITSKKVTVSKSKAAGKRIKLKKEIRKDKVSKVSPGKITNVRHYNFETNNTFKFDTKKIKKELLKKQIGAPTKLEISLEPNEGKHIVYHETPGFTSLEKPLAQLSVRAVIFNKGTKSVDLDKVEIEYKTGSQTVKKQIYLPSNMLIIDPWYAWVWQNSREYHEDGDIVFMEYPFPDKINLKFYFKKYSKPISISKDLKPYTNSHSLPFKSKDFGKDEYVTGYSMHGGGDQVFAYDVGVQAYESNAWRDLHPGKNDKENKNFRIWGKPVYAMADGKILNYENNIPNNWKPDGTDEGLLKQESELWGSYDHGGSGNHFYIKHGNVVALYAHLQKGSLNKKLLKKGKKVLKGDLLGKAGNSGNSTAPHTHIHIKTYTKDSEPEGGIFRPLVFNNGYIIGQAHYKKPKSNINWSKLKDQGIPGMEGKACFIFPSDRHPYCEYPNIWGEVCKFGVPEKIYQEEFDKIWTCGYYPVWVDGYDVGGKTFFNVIFRPSKNIDWVARHNMDGTKYQNEFDKWDKEKYRLLNINSYLLKGKVRYAAVWVKNQDVKWFSYHGKTLAWHESNFEKHRKAGWIPSNVSCVYISGKTLVTALWEKKKTGGFYLKPDMKLDDFIAAFKQYSDIEKFKLVYLDGYVKNGKPRLSGIWYKNVPNYNSWWEKYHKSAAQFQTEYNTMLQKGYLTRCIAGYSDGGIARFEGIWSK